MLGYFDPVKAAGKLAAAFCRHCERSEAIQPHSRFLIAAAPRASQ